MRLLKKITWEQYVQMTIGDIKDMLLKEYTEDTYMYTNKGREICFVDKPDRTEVPPDLLVEYGYLAYDGEE